VIGTYIFTALALLVAGVAIGVLVMVCLGINQDDRPGGFPADTNDLTVLAARRVTGAGTRSLEPADEASRRQDVLPV
jgi:hypothetical protein